MKGREDPGHGALEAQGYIGMGNVFMEKVKMSTYYKSVINNPLYACLAISKLSQLWLCHPKCGDLLITHGETAACMLTEIVLVQ